MEKELILEVKNLHTSFKTGKGEINIVKDVSFNLHRGETLAVVGESGCGKSVTVHSIMQLLPSNGYIKGGEVNYYDGKGKETISAHKKNGKAMRSIRGAKIGMVFQDPMSSLNPVYTVGSQIIESLRQHRKMSKAEAMKMALEMLKKLGIPDPEKRINDYPHQFSGGMKQRVVIAIAMICNPDIIIADEPTTALDVTIQAQIMELMKSLQVNDNKSIILITHNMGLVAEMADQVAVMYMGRVVEYGKINDIFENPSHPYTSALLKSVPVLGMDKSQELVTIPGSTPSPVGLKPGCEFADRCPHAKEGCRGKDIPNFEITPGHHVRCILFNDHQEVR